MRQAGPKAKGAFVTYDLKNISIDSSFLEMLDVLNEQLVANRQEPIAFDHDCREGICGLCRSISMVTLSDQTQIRYSFCGWVEFSNIRKY